MDNNNYSPNSHHTEERSSSPLRTPHGFYYDQPEGGGYQNQQQVQQQQQQFYQQQYKKTQQNEHLQGSSKHTHKMMMNDSHNLQQPDMNLPPTTHFTLGPQQEGVPPPTTIHMRQRIQDIETDNQSLLRRLNLVLQEFERVKREKGNLIQRMQTSINDQSEIERMITSEDNDKVNKFMHGDLEFEGQRNQKMKAQITEIEFYRSQMIKDLQKMKELQSETMNDNSELAYSLQAKLGQIEDIEREITYIREKVGIINNAIDNSKRDLLDSERENRELQRIVAQLAQERNELLERLEDMQRKYEECCKEISEERAQMESHNKQHAKLITAKIIFVQLESIQNSIMNQGFQDFKNYCSFDSNFQSKLSKLANVMLEIGNFKQRIAIRQWFGLALKPVESRLQSEQISAEIHGVKLKQIYFRKWFTLYTTRMDKYTSKARGVRSIIQKLLNEELIETKRGFQIWKEDVQNFRLQKARVKKLVWKLYFDKISIAWNNWRNHSNNLDSQVRLNLLSQNFSQKQYLTILFHNFKYQVSQSKSKRQNVLFHCLKSWQDYLAYQKFIMGSNLSLIKFKFECNKSLLKACFDAFKIHKEEQKQNKANYQLNEVEMPRVEELTIVNENIVIESKFKVKSRACESVKKMLAKQLYGYFQQWKSVTDDYKETLRTTVKDKLIKLYMQKIGKAFSAWKIKHQDVKIQTQQMEISEMQQEQIYLQNEVISMQREVQGQQEVQDCSQQKHVLKCVESYNKRLKQLAIGRWRDQVNSMNIKEDGAAKIIRRLRLRMLRKAFDFYLEGVNEVKKDGKDQERCLMFQKTRDERLSKRVFQGWIIYKSDFLKAKSYWNRLYLRLDFSMKKTALKKWQQLTQKKAERELQNEQDMEVRNIEELNNQIGMLHIEDTAQQAQINQTKQTLTNQAQRIIANAFARFFYVNETRGFEKWKEYVSQQKQKERLIKKFIGHMQKYQFNHIRSCFKTWILNSDINQRKQELKREDMRLEDVELQIEVQEQCFQQKQERIREETQSVNEVKEVYNQRLQKSVQIIINKVNNNHFTSNKRYILQQWRQYLQREVQLINCVKNVITKSLWAQGFQQIKNCSRQVNKDRNQENTLEMFRKKFWKRTCENAFSVWRSGQFQVIQDTIESVDQQTNQAVQSHNDRKNKVKEVNANRALKLITTHNLRNLFQSWKNVISYLKTQSKKNKFCQIQINHYLIRNALNKWHQRKQATKMARVKFQRLKQKVERIRLRQYFNAIKMQFTNTEVFCARMANLANTHDHQQLKVSFAAIESFARAKSFVQTKQKNQSSGTIAQIIEGIIKRKKQMYLTELRMRCLNKRKVEKTKAMTILLNIGNKMRYFFTLWKQGADQRTLKLEMHNEGPVREEIFQQKMELSNIKGFLNKEGYDNNDIAQALKDGKQRSDGLILKSLRRMEHYNEELYVKPKCFDRWRQYVHMRRLFKYWLGVVDQRGKFVKSDVHFAFNKWRNYFKNRVDCLRKLKKHELEKRLMRNNQIIDGLAEIIESKENETGFFNAQREALVDKFINAQRLALSLWVNHEKKTLHEAFGKWFKIIKNMRSQEATDGLKKNLELLDFLKNRIRQLEDENEMLANENEDFRQFSLDGYEMAKNVNQLTLEREKLSVDLADKASMISKLLDENDSLSGNLKSAQDEASTLLKSTMAESSSNGFRTGKKSNVKRNIQQQQSPYLQRSAHY